MQWPISKCYQILALGLCHLSVRFDVSFNIGKEIKLIGVDGRMYLYMYVEDPILGFLARTPSGQHEPEERESVQNDNYINEPKYSPRQIAKRVGNER